MPTVSKAHVPVHESGSSDICVMGRNGYATECREKMSFDLDYSSRLAFDTVSCSPTEPYRPKCFTQISEEPRKRGNSKAKLDR